MRPYVLLVDAKNLLWRAEAAMGLLSANGTPTGGIHGFLSILLRVMDQYQPERLVICWDDWKNGPAARKEMVATYKQRDPKPSPEREQIQKRVQSQQKGLMEFFRHLGVKQARSPRWEADDVMGTLAKRYAERDVDVAQKVLIFTGDRDLLQCISKTVMVLRPMQDGTIKEETAQTVKEAYGVNVSQFISYKALVGDTSDGYSGCRGIGEKSASAILQKFHDVREVLYNHDKPSWAPLNKRWADLIKAGQQDILDCQKLATINTRAPLKFLKRKPDYQRAMRMLHKWQMKTMLTQFSKLKHFTWREATDD